MDHRPPEHVSAATDFPLLAPGKRTGAGRFVLKKILGRGGMGVVWLAQDTRLNELVALKCLPPQIRAVGAGLTTLRRETLRSRKLTHPNIVRIHDLHEPENEDAFIAMEFVDGPTLNALRLRQPNEMFSWPRLAPLVKQLCDALDYAHGEHVIHRDLKPGNLMLDAKGRLKLADFGLATIISDSLSRVTNTQGGTPAYMSPQQMNGLPPQPTDDLYSLGATLYELLAGTPPFYTGQIVHQVLHNRPTALGERLAENAMANEIPPNVEAMIMACLAKEPEQRPQSARAAADWIGWTQTPHPKSLETTLTPPEEIRAKTESTSPRKNLVAAAAILLLLIAAVTGVWFFIADKNRKSASGSQVAPLVADASQKNSSNAEMDPLRPIADGTNELINGESLLALEPENSSKISGTRMQQDIISGALSQKWILIYAGDGYYKIRNAASGLWLTDPDGATTNGAPLQMQTELSDSARDSQLWKPSAMKGGFAFSNKAGEIWISNSGGSHLPGNEIFLWEGPVDSDDVWFWGVTSGALARNRLMLTQPGTVVLEDFDNFPDGEVFRDRRGEGTVLAENGNHFLRLQSADFWSKHEFFSQFHLPRNWEKFILSARVRTHGLKISGQNDDGAQLNLGFWDGPHLIDLGRVGEVVQHDSDWTEKTITIQRSVVPRPDVTFQITFGLDHAFGTADLDDLRVIVTN